MCQQALLNRLEPIFEPVFDDANYGYRRGRSAHGALRKIWRELDEGREWVVDADLAEFFGQIPHAELLKSVARRVSDGRMLGWVKAWLEMAVEQDDGEGGKRRTNRARRERKGTPQGSPVSPLLSNIYMRRFVLGWKVLGYARCFEAGVVNYADDLVVLGKVPSAVMLSAVESLMERLKLPINAQKTRCLTVPEEPVEFLGYRIGRNYRRDTGRAYIGTRPSPASVQSICRRLSALTAARYGLLDSEIVVGRLNRLMTGWANYFNLGQVSPAYAAVDRHATRRLRRWLCHKHKVRTGRYVRFPDEQLWNEYGLTRLDPRTASFPWAKA
jgi:group II intron reverse transcriptase/maturase